MASYQCQGCAEWVDTDKDDIDPKAIENTICNDCLEDWKTEAYTEQD